MSDAEHVVKDSSWDDGAWTQVPNEIVRDRALSLEAKGLILVVASHSTNFKITLPELRLQVGVGREKLHRILKELEAAGYMRRESTYQLVDGRCRRGPNRYLLARSRTSGHVTGFQAVGNPCFEEREELPGQAVDTGFQAVGNPPVEELPAQAVDTGLQTPGVQTPGNPTSYKKNIFKKTKNYKDTSSTAARSAALAVDFDEFWAAYPKKVSKGGARRKYELAVRRGIDPLQILAAVKRYAEAKHGTDRQFIKDPTTWLNQECWDDEIVPTPTLDIPGQLPSQLPSQLPPWRRSSTFVTSNGRLMER